MPLSAEERAAGYVREVSAFGELYLERADGSRVLAKALRQTGT